ncbi:MAG: energy-coupling factor transporter transmembrane component T [Spirochaetota bacterium]
MTQSRFKYIPGNTFFHKMDPTWKFGWNFIIVIIIIINFHLLYTVFWYLYILILAFIVAKISIRQYIRSVAFFLVIGLFIATWQTVYYPEAARVLFTWGPVRVTAEGIIEGISTLFRILVIVSLSVLFTLTTDPRRMVESLIQVGKIPYRIGYMAYNTLKLIPLYENESMVIQNAHKIRGVGDEGKGFKSRMKLYWSLLIPLLVSGIRRAQASAIAMDSRGFGAYSKRTIIHAIIVSRSTKIFTFVHAAICVVLFVYFVILGHGIVHIG